MPVYEVSMPAIVKVRVTADNPEAALKKADDDWVDWLWEPADTGGAVMNGHARLIEPHP